MTATQELPTALLGAGVRTAFYGLVIVTVIGELLRDVRAITTHQLLNVHRLQCTAYAFFACAVTWEIFLHGWHAFSDRQLICLFALLHTSSLPPFWQHGRPCSILFQSIFPLLRTSSASDLIGVESSQVSIPFTVSSKALADPSSVEEQAQAEEESASPAAPAASSKDDGAPELQPPQTEAAQTALRTIHRGLAFWFLAIMALEVTWNIPAIMFWARSFRQACVEPASEPGGGCEAYAFFLFFRVRAYGWMRWLQLAWYTIEFLKTLSLTARICAVLGAVSRLDAASTTTEAADAEACGHASCSHGPPADAAGSTADGTSAPLLPATTAAHPPLPLGGVWCGCASHWHKAQRHFAAALLRGDAPPPGTARLPRRVSARRAALKLLLGLTVLTLTAATVECNLRWNSVQASPAGWDFGQTLAAAAAAVGVILLVVPGRDIMLSLVEDTYFGGEA